MIFKSITLLIILTLISCGNQGQRSLVLTDNENKGLKEILDFYGGICDYKVRNSFSTENGKRKSFEIEISSSEVVEQYVKNVAMAASNIAYFFYKNLKEERNTYDEISIILAFKDGKKISFNFLPKHLDLVDKRMSVVYKIVEYLKQKRYNEVALMIVSTPQNIIDTDGVTTTLTTTESNLGMITKGFQPLGFRIFNGTESQEILHITGIIARGKVNTAFSIELDLNGSKDEIWLLKYDI